MNNEIITEVDGYFMLYDVEIKLPFQIQSEKNKVI